jgi:hypothetical protein
MSQNNNYSQQNPNNMPRRDPPKAPETIEYICGGEPSTRLLFKGKQLIGRLRSKDGNEDYREY